MMHFHIRIGGVYGVGLASWIGEGETSLENKHPLLVEDVRNERVERKGRHDRHMSHTQSYMGFPHDVALP